jgi:uncharacterized protein with FMN-binding domain
MGSTAFTNVSSLGELRDMNQAAKKALVSAIIVGSFIIYSLIHGRAGAATPIALVPRAATATSTDTPSPTVSDGTTTPGATATATATPAALYKNGTYDGSVADAQWGYIQVRAVIQGGQITDVKFLQYPNERSRSVEINNYADPILTSEAIQAQSANVDLISGATDSSYAFIQSLGDALSNAQA